MARNRQARKEKAKKGKNVLYFTFAKQVDMIRFDPIENALYMNLEMGPVLFGGSPEAWVALGFILENGKRWTPFEKALTLYPEQEALEQGQMSRDIFRLTIWNKVHQAVK